MVAASCLVCHLTLVVDMNRGPPTAGRPSSSSSLSSAFKPCSQFSAIPRLVSFGFRLEFPRNERFWRRLKFVVSAELSKSFSLSFGLDSQALQPPDTAQLPWLGPVPGDIAEIEAYCRIFRSAEWLHVALMDKLCNPFTGECYVLYDFTSDEKPALKDKIVSVLGCMVSLLNKGREDVLSGRSSMMNSFRVADVSAMEDKLPPLAIFRGEMKRCCESLHVALENYLLPGDDRSLDVWRKLQGLKNACYDATFPREENYPTQTLFANWTPVYLSSSKEEIGSNNSEVAFWKGGQVTEEGLEWLLKKRYKTIVDLRAESIKDNFYQAAIDNAIASGKIELVKIPVTVRTAPSMEQVEKFAILVSDCNTKPIYLHSKEGIQRTSAMVSRWRQYMTWTRNAFQFNINQSFAPDDASSLDKNGTIEGQKPSNSEKEPLQGNEIQSLKESLDTVDKVSGAYNEHEMIGSANGVYNDVIYNQGMTSVETENGGEVSLANSFTEIDPVKAQVPPCNFFSRKEMSMFLRRKRISPPTYFNYQLKMLEKLPVSRNMYIGTTHIGTTQRGEILGNDQVPGLAKGGSSNGSYNEKKFSPKPQKPKSGNGEYMTGASCVSVGRVMNGFPESKRTSVVETNFSATVSNNYYGHVESKLLKENQKSNGRAPSVSSDDEIGPVEGDMCASTTGVLRVQSRKKAEMFLVRTDGFSCTREKVTEASLAFTHLSTQQQMLMWKTTPKMVLLLKKLGSELMEEAKEVASFLYYQREHERSCGT